jgi:hypothetical protein
VTARCEPRLYLLVRRDLPRSAQAVQAAHAAAELVYRRHDELIAGWGRFGPTISLLGLDNRDMLESWRSRLGTAAVTFNEPDLDGSPTAIAYFGEDTFGLAQLRLL